MSWKRKAASAALAFLVPAWGAIAQLAPPLPDLNADQIVERNVAARGGLAAWRRITAMSWIGHLEGEHAPLGGAPFVMLQARPNKTQFEVKAVGQPSLRVFDGVHGWKAKPGRADRPEVQAYSPQEEKYAARSPGLQGPLIDHQARGNEVALEGVDDIDGRRAYRMRVQLASGEVDHVWLDVQTYLEIRTDRPSYGPPEANQSVTMFYGEYRDFDGVKLPTIIETGAAHGQTPDRMVIERVLLNPRLDKHAFTEPGAHRTRGRYSRGFAEVGPARRESPAMSAAAVKPDPKPSQAATTP